MNAIQKILSMNEKELAQNVSDAASWHADYKDTSYIYIGNLHQDLKDEDILKIFSQYGNPTHLNMIKDKETGKSRGFCYLKYEDHRSCILAIDNLNGVKIFDRPMKIDHTYYRLLEGQNEDDFLVKYPEPSKEDVKRTVEHKKPKLLPYVPETRDDDLSDPMLSTQNIEDNDFADPMAGFLAESKTTDESKDRHRTHRNRTRHRDTELERDKRRKLTTSKKSS